MSSDEQETDVSGLLSAGSLHDLPGCVRYAKFFLTGCNVMLPGRLVKKVDSFARRILREPRRRLCP